MEQRSGCHGCLGTSGVASCCLWAPPGWLPRSLCALARGLSCCWEQDPFPPAGSFCSWLREALPPGPLTLPSPSRGTSPAPPRLFAAPSPGPCHGSEGAEVGWEGSSLWLAAAGVGPCWLWPLKAEAEIFLTCPGVWLFHAHTSLAPVLPGLEHTTGRAVSFSTSMCGGASAPQRVP